MAWRVLDLAREERAAVAQLAQYVATEGGVLLEKGDQSAVEGPVAAAHACLEERQVLDRVDERVPLDELSLLPEQPLELGGVERTEAAPEDEMLRRRDGRDRVELEEAEPAHGLEHAPGRVVGGGPGSLAARRRLCRRRLQP